MTTFPQVLSGLLAHDPGRPLVTFYDDATGERTELSVTTYANWVAKVASLLVDELEVEQRQSGTGRPPRPLARPGGAGRCLGRRPRGGLGGRAGRGRDRTRRPRPVGRRGDTDPGGRQRPAPARRSVPRSPAGRRPRSRRRGVVAARRVRRMAGAGGRRPRRSPASPSAELWRAAAVGIQITDGGRLLSETSPASPSGLASFTEPLARSGSMVLVTHTSEERRERIAADERVTARFDPGQPARS